MPRPTRRLAIPTFTLCGEPPGPPLEMLHIEPIQSRSRLQRWEIDAHTHPRLHQPPWVASGPAEVVLKGERTACQGPVMGVIPPGAVHAFRSTRETDGSVLTFDPRAVIEGDVPATGEALRNRYAAPRTLPLDPAAAATGRIAMLMADLGDEFAPKPASPRSNSCTTGRRSRPPEKCKFCPAAVQLRCRVGAENQPSEPQQET